MTRLGQNFDIFPPDIASTLPNMSTPTRIKSTSKSEPSIHHDDIREAEKLGVGVEEVVVTRVSEEDLMQISRDCLDVHSKAGFRLTLIVIVMGFNMAG
jgi:hypothetical protein